jgi:heme A synthase
MIAGMPAVARFAWWVLAYTVAVILWGAYVRATGSGAGCGDHWPLCNGEILPRSPGVETLVEFSHRLTSGLALLAVVALLVWTFRACRPGHPARLGAVLSLFFMITEAAVGAGLVLFQLVADNASMARAMFMAVHLLNTFLLLAAIALTGWWLSGGRRVTLAGHGAPAAWLAAGCAGLLLAGASGAVAALGDTLFPAATLTQAIRDDLSASSHLLVRLRIFHPALAIGAAATVVLASRRLAREAGPAAARGATLVVALTALQVALGFLNVLLLAPVWLQLVHLLIADAIWVGLVLLGAHALGERPRGAVAAQAA